MRICPNCGERDNPYWRASRFDFNADYMKEEDFAVQFPLLFEALGPKPETLGDGSVLYYRRGKKEKQVYRVLREDYKIETEKSKPQPWPKTQLKLSLIACNPSKEGKP